jgi:glycerophosphoryl diester phosphodiesterase
MAKSTEGAVHQGKHIAAQLVQKCPNPLWRLPTFSANHLHRQSNLHPKSHIWFSRKLPKQTGTGGKVQLGSISKRGDTYVRTLLIHGARSVLNHAKEPGPWLEQIKQRRPANVVVVAQAAKMARTIWAVTAKEQDYQRGFQSIRPLAA